MLCVYWTGHLPSFCMYISSLQTTFFLSGLVDSVSVVMHVNGVIDSSSM